MSIRAEHHTAEEETPVVDAAATQRGQGRHDRIVHHLPAEGVVGPGHRRESTHPTGVGALVAVIDSFVVTCRSHEDGRRAVTRGEDRELVAVEVLLDDEGPPRVAERLSREIAVDARIGLGPGRHDGHSLACSEAIGLDHVGRPEAVEEHLGLFGVGERAIRGSGHTCLDQQLLHPRLGSLELRSVCSGSEDQPAGGSQSIGQAVDQRCLGPDDEQIGIDLFGAIEVDPGMPGFPGETTTSWCRPSASASACSRPPPPTTQTRTISRPDSGIAAGPDQPPPD